MIKKKQKQKALPRSDLWPQSDTWTDLHHRCYSTLAKIFGQPSCRDGNRIVFFFLKGERLFSRAGQRKLSRPGWRVPGPSAADGVCQCLTPRRCVSHGSPPKFRWNGSEWREEGGWRVLLWWRYPWKSARVKLFSQGPQMRWVKRAASLGGALTVLLQGFI